MNTPQRPDILTWTNGVAGIAPRRCHSRPGLQHPRNERKAVKSIRPTTTRPRETSRLAFRVGAKSRVPEIGGKVYCGRCGVLVIVDDQRNHQFPPFTPPRLLRCSCCGRELPQFAFYHERAPRAALRGYRTAQCRSCMAFKKRVLREKRGAEITERDRVRAQEWRAANPGYHRPKTAAQVKAEGEAVKRYKARKAGRPVPKRKAGRPVILLKAICRIRATCPLADFCRDKEPDTPQPA